MDLPQITAAPSEIDFEGKTYRLTPLADQDFGEFQRWMQDNYIDLAKRNLDGLSEADRSSFLAHAYDEAAKLTLDSPETLRIMRTVDGAAKLLWLSLRREHPELTFQDAKVLCTKVEFVKWSMERIDRINRLNLREESALKKKLQAKKKRPRKRKKRR